MRILERDLDDEQLEIAKASDRSLLVVAGPGSGKTHLLTHVAAYQVRRSHPTRWRVLCLTFGVEAARQMRTRLADRALEVPARRRIEVANFHQFALQTLGHHGHHIGWPRDAQVLDELEAQEVAKEVADQLGLRALSGRDAHQAIERLRNNRRPDVGNVPTESLVALRVAYERRLDALRVHDFDDLILRSIELLDAVPDVAAIVRQTYGYVVVDELQDTSGWQLEFVARITDDGATTIFAVADNDQMIYEWRDARAENMVEWEARFGAERVSLLGNYRCPPRIVEAANSLITHNEGAFDRPALPYSRVTDRSGEILVIRTSGEEDEGVTVAGAVGERLAAGVPPAKIAVLASVGFLLEPAVASFTEAGIHFIRIGEDPAASSEFARALRAALVLAATPGQDRARSRLTRLLSGGVPDEEVETVIGELVESRSATILVSRLAELAELPLDDQTVQRARQVIALAEREFGVEPPTVTGRRIALDWHRLSRQLQREANAVKVMTTFAAKGLEFNTVLIPGFNDGLVPYVRRASTPSDRWWTEERRKLYVAVTRTEDQLVLLVRAGRAPSRFLGELGIRPGEHFRWIP